MNTKNTSKQLFLGKTAFVCGGSKGIGKETAKEFFRQGGSVCILARETGPLQEAAREIEALRLNEEQFIEIIAGDATQLSEIEPGIIQFINLYGTPDYLINAVGYAYPEYVQNLNLDDFRSNMHTNYYGQLTPTFIFLPFFIAQGKGHISFISSMMGFMGVIGYASYAPTKFAIVGLAEVLRHELAPHNIKISVLYPPDTQTPGFDRENLTKPVETAVLSESAKLFMPEMVARLYLKGILNEKFHIMMGEGKWIWRIFRISPTLVYKILDNDLRKARKDIKVSNK